MIIPEQAVETMAADTYAVCTYTGLTGRWLGSRPLLQVQAAGTVQD